MSWICLGIFVLLVCNWPYFPRLGRFSVIISLHMLSVLFSLLSFWYFHNVNFLSVDSVPSFMQTFFTLLMFFIYFLLWMDNIKRSVFRFADSFSTWFYYYWRSLFHFPVIHFILQFQNVCLVHSYYFSHFAELLYVLLMSFLKIIILYYFSVNSHIYVSLGSVWEVIVSLVVLCFFAFSCP